LGLWHFDLLDAAKAGAQGVRRSAIIAGLLTAAAAGSAAPIAAVTATTLAHGINAGAQGIRLTRTATITGAIAIALGCPPGSVAKAAFGATVTAWCEALWRLTTGEAGTTTTTAATAAFVT